MAVGYGEAGLNYDPGLSGSGVAKSQWNQSGGIQVGNDPKPDGLMSCLSRIRDLTSEFGMDVRRIEGIADTLSGARPENPNKAAGQPPEPMNALFIARQIEMAMGEILTAQRGQIARLEQAIG